MTPAICHVYIQGDQARDRLGDELAHLARLGIPADLTISPRPDPALLPHLRAFAAGGGLIAPSLYPPDLDPACPDSNWWAYDAAECRRLLGLARDRWSSLGLGGLEAITTYTPGNGLITACREAGVRFLLGFCAPTVINDGHWQITHSGAPLAPYLASGDDFRRPAAAGDAVLISSMELRNPLTCAEHWSEGPFCPLNLAMGDRTIECGEQPVETFAACEDWMRLSELSGTPRWFHINLQWFTSPRCFDLNRRCLEWLARQARMGRLRFATLRSRRDELLAAGGVAAQTTWWRGSCMGQTIGGQPAGGVECIVHESPAGQWIFRRGGAGARRHYDWLTPWSFPPFDPLGREPRFATEPARLDATAAIDGARVAVELRWRAPAPGRLCAWEALTGLRGPFRLVDAGGLDAEVVPHPGGVGGALLIAASTTEGTARVLLEHAGAAAATGAVLGGLMAAETVRIDDRPATRLAPLVPARVRLPVAVACRHHVRWERIDGATVQRGLLAPGGVLEVELDGRKGASLVRLWDAEAADLSVAAADLEAERGRLLAADRAAAAEFAPGLPAPQAPLAFCAEDESPAWAVLAARTAADRAIATADAIAGRLGGGRPVAVMHCAADLPFGTQGRVRSQRHDRSWSDGAELFAIYYDYGQSHGFGITGWNQFWQIDLGMRRHSAGRAHRLVLNLFDPESRGGAVRILGRACDDHGRALPDSQAIELRPQQPLAQGIAARHTPAAFAVIDLPPQLAAAGCIDIAIRSHSEGQRYDRLAEGFGYVFLAHAWLFAR